MSSAFSRPACLVRVRTAKQVGKTPPSQERFEGAVYFDELRSNLLFLERKGRIKKRRNTRLVLSLPASDDLSVSRTILNAVGSDKSSIDRGIAGETTRVGTYIHV